MEILLPLLFTGVLIVLRQKVPVKDYPDATVYQSFSVSSLPNEMLNRFQLAFVPRNSSVVRQVAEDVRGKLELSAGRFTPNSPPMVSLGCLIGIFYCVPGWTCACSYCVMHDFLLISELSTLSFALIVIPDKSRSTGSSGNGYGT